MNTIPLIDPDALLIFAAVSASFLLGCVHRLVRGLGQQRWEVADTGADVRDLLQRCDQQQNRVKRMQEEMEQMRGALQARAARAPARTPVRAVREVPAADARTASSRSSSRSSRADPFKLARSGATVDTIMARCKLSRAEAELVYSVHGAGMAQSA